jgi:hypothetical protein
MNRSFLSANRNPTPLTFFSYCVQYTSLEHSRLHNLSFKFQGFNLLALLRQPRWALTSIDFGKIWRRRKQALLGVSSFVSSSLVDTGQGV